MQWYTDLYYRPVCNGIQTCTTDLYTMVYRPVLQTCMQWYTDLYYRPVYNGIQTCIQWYTDLYTMVYRPVYNGIQTCIQWYTDLYYRPVHNVSKPLHVNFKGKIPHVKFKGKIPFNGGNIHRLERSERILSFYANH